MINDSKKQGRIFNNYFLESLTKSNPTTAILYYSAVIFFIFFLSFKYTTLSLGATVGFYLIGLFVWTFMEYILHRFLFHINDYFPVLKKLHYALHGVHHENPRDQERLFMPPVPGTIITIFLFLGWNILFGSATFAFMAGIINGYLFYSYVHYSVHTKPVYQPFRKLWKNHALHHYKYQDKAYGVSSPLWDIVFGTMPPKGCPELNDQE